MSNAVSESIRLTRTGPGNNKERSRGLFHAVLYSKALLRIQAGQVVRSRYIHQGGHFQTG
jgi:hypothetical protein